MGAAPSHPINFVFILTASTKVLLLLVQLSVYVLWLFPLACKLPPSISFMLITNKSKTWLARIKTNGAQEGCRDRVPPFMQFISVEGVWITSPADIRKCLYSFLQDIPPPSQIILPQLCHVLEYSEQTSPLLHSISEFLNSTLLRAFHLSQDEVGVSFSPDSDSLVTNA